MFELKKPPEEIWDKYWLGVYNRIERTLGWILLSIGSVILLTFALYEGAKALLQFLSAPSIPFILKIGLLAVLGGAVILIVSVIREKIFTAKSDKYQKEVLR